MEEKPVTKLVLDGDVNLSGLIIVRGRSVRFGPVVLLKIGRKGRQSYYQKRMSTENRDVTIAH